MMPVRVYEPVGVRRVPTRLGPVSGESASPQLAARTQIAINVRKLFMAAIPRECSGLLWDPSVRGATMETVGDTVLGTVWEFHAFLLESCMRLCFGDLTLDLSTRQLLREKQEIRLSPKAFELLKLLVEDRPRA